ncbi:MAG: hypothetical protein FWC50_05970 [Planctomycetaceae bacterium]|nr:hypothetical protein [Planctomycetaceae bacterium]
MPNVRFDPENVILTCYYKRYYVKQSVQETAMQLPPFEQVENHIDVIE